MNTYRGFSLTEVLISLFLISSASLGFITQQCHITHLSSQLKSSSEEWIARENNAERLLVYSVNNFNE